MQTWLRSWCEAFMQMLSSRRGVTSKKSMSLEAVFFPCTLFDTVQERRESRMCAHFRTYPAPQHFRLGNRRLFGEATGQFRISGRYSLFLLHFRRAPIQNSTLGAVRETLLNIKITDQHRASVACRQNQRCAKNKKHENRCSTAVLCVARIMCGRGCGFSFSRNACQSPARCSNQGACVRAFLRAQSV